MSEERKDAIKLWLYGCSEEICREVECLTIHQGYQCVAISDLSQMDPAQKNPVKDDSAEDRNSVMIVDASDYETDYAKLIDEIRQIDPLVGLLVLMPDDSATYCNRMLEAGADMAFAVEELSRLLLECLENLRVLTSQASLYYRLATSQKEENQMKKNGILQTPVSRRSFLKGSLAATAAVGLFGCAAPADETTVGTTPEETIPETTPEAPVVEPEIEEQVYCGTCRGNCAGGCFLNIHVRDGKVVRTSMREFPDPAYNRICIKGLTHPYRIYNPNRLKYPMRRVGERGAGQWEQISWDEAIKEISDKWKGYQAEFGKDSVATYIGSGSYAACSGAALGGSAYRFRAAIGASGINTCVDAAYPQGIPPVLGAMGIMAGANEPKDLLNAKTIIIWGANPVNSQQQTTHFILEAKDKGAKIICIDPMYTGTAAKADVYVPIRAGTDAVLAYAMMNVVLDKDLVDWEFVKAHTDAGMLVKKSDKTFLRLSDIRALADGESDVPVMMKQDGTFDVYTAVEDPVLRGTYEVNGISVTTAFDIMMESISKYKPEDAARICNIPVAQIEEIVDIYTSNTPSSIYTFLGIDHYVNGHYGYRGIAMLALLTGNIGKPGAMCSFGEATAANVVNFMSQVPANGTFTTLSLPITMLSEIMDSGKYGARDVTLKSMYISHANVIGNSGDRNKVIAGLKKVEFLVVADMNMNETAQYADILLPVAHWFEVNDIHGSFGTSAYITLQEKAIEPPYECKSDFEIQKLLSTAMGNAADYDMDEFDFIKMWIDSDGARAVGLTYETLMEKKAVRFLPGDNFVEYAGGNFPTADGRGHFYIETPAVADNYGQEWNPDHERVAYWEPPYEAWHENPLHEKYPFHQLGIHPKWRTHSQWWDVPVLEEISGPPMVHINPADAQQKGIVQGDQVKIFNDRGYVVMVANLDNGIQPGTIAVPHGWEKGQFIDGHYQDLSHSVMHAMTMNTGFFDVLVDFEKV